MTGLPLISDAEILAARPAKNAVDPRRPYAFLVERERSAEGRVDPVATVFLTNRECPFRCLMCDLWQNTTETSVRPGDIPAQIQYALRQLPPAEHIKLYNSGNFFDRKAIPPGDYATIARQVRRFQTVIVENHPSLCGPACPAFRDLLEGQLELALGLETVHPQILPVLNKRMTLDLFARAVEYLLGHRIPVRCFILLRPPFLSDAEGVEWAVRSLRYAFSLGVRCCSVVPTRAGNGIMEILQQRRDFQPPSLTALEETLDAGLALDQGRVFVDLWDIEKFYACPRCGPLRAERLQRMNWSQQIEARVSCDCRELEE